MVASSQANKLLASYGIPGGMIVVVASVATVEFAVVVAGSFDANGERDFTKSPNRCNGPAAAAGGGGGGIGADAPREDLHQWMERAKVTHLARTVSLPRRSHRSVPPVPECHRLAAGQVSRRTC